MAQPLDPTEQANRLNMLRLAQWGAQLGAAQAAVSAAWLAETQAHADMAAIMAVLPFDANAYGQAMSRWLAARTTLSDLQDDLDPLIENVQNALVKMATQEPHNLYYRRFMKGFLTVTGTGRD